MYIALQVKHCMEYCPYYFRIIIYYLHYYLNYFLYILNNGYYYFLIFTIGLYTILSLFQHKMVYVKKETL